MKKILIFKTDKLGDFLNITPVIKNIKIAYPDCSIDLICSKYNYSISKYFYKDINLIIIKKPLIMFFLKNYKKFFLNKYDFLIQLDGKSHSYFSSIFIRSRLKGCLNFQKQKRIFGKKITVSRPNTIIKYFFSKCVISKEDYNIKENNEYHYLTLYLKLISLFGIKIKHRKHYFPKINFNNKSKFDDKYIYIHIDERWSQYNSYILDSLCSIIKNLSETQKIVISSNKNGNFFFDKISKIFNSFDNVDIIKGPDVNDVVSLVYFSHTCISNHSGLIVHLAAALKKNVIDVVSKDIYNELDRWVPLDISYKRVDIDKFVSSDFNYLNDAQ